MHFNLQHLFTHLNSKLPPGAKTDQHAETTFPSQITEAQLFFAPGKQEVIFLTDRIKIKLYSKDKMMLMDQCPYK